MPAWLVSNIPTEILVLPCLSLTLTGQAPALDMPVTTLLLSTVLAMIPAATAQNKGRNFRLWWLFGFFFFIVALPAALLIKPCKPIRVEGREAANCAPEDPPANGPAHQPYVAANPAAFQFAGESDPNGSMIDSRARNRWTVFARL